MAISAKSKIKISEKFNKIFPGANQKVLGQKENGSAEQISVHVPSIPGDKVILVAELISLVPCNSHITRSGTGVTISFF